MSGDKIIDCPRTHNVLAAQTCLQEVSRPLWQYDSNHADKASSCYLSSHEYLYRVDPTFKQRFDINWDSSGCCSRNERLTGILYSMDIGAYGPNFYKLQNICLDPATGVERTGVPWMAEADKSHPNYVPTSSYQPDVTLKTRNSRPRCWNSKLRLMQIR